MAMQFAKEETSMFIKNVPLKRANSTQEITPNTYSKVVSTWMYLIPTVLAIIILIITSVTLHATQDKCDSPIHTSTTLQQHAPSYVTNNYNAEVKFSSGRADFSKPVAVGASITAGYMSRALSENSQTLGYAVQLVKQFKKAMAGEGTVRLLSYKPMESDGALAIATPAGTIRFVDNRVESITEEGGFVHSTDARITYIDSIPSELYTLVAAPGMKLVDYMNLNVKVFPQNPSDPYPFNPYVFRSFNANKTFFEDVMEQADDATFFISAVDLFGNDVLSYATSGGMGKVRAADDTSPRGPNDITHPSVIDKILGDIIQPFVNNKAGGVLASVPDITLLPYFHAIKWDDFQAQPGLAFPPTMTFVDFSGQAMPKNLTLNVTGSNGFPYIGTNKETNRPTIEQATTNDLINAGVAALEIYMLHVCMYTTLGPCLALSDGAVLDATEAGYVKAAVQAYTELTIKHAVTNDWAFCDMNTYFRRFWSDGGLVMNGIGYYHWDLFSLDLVHPNPRGAAAIANLLLEAIDSQYETNFAASDKLINLALIPQTASVEGAISTLHPFEASNYLVDALPFSPTNERLTMFE